MNKRVMLAAALLAFAGCATQDDDAEVAPVPDEVAPVAPQAIQPPDTVTTSYQITMQHGEPVMTRGGKLAAHHPSRIIVKLAPGATAPWLAGSRARGLGADRDLYVVENPSGLSAREAVRQYRLRPDVVFAEPDYVITTDATPTDPRYPEQWDMVKIDAPNAWDTHPSAAGVVVAVIDSGIDFTHPDLQGNLYTDPVTGAHGYTCIGTCTAGGLDDYGHGTHVAGTIGAATNNGIGVAGVDWNVQLLSVKFIGPTGSGFTSDAILAFDQVTALKQAGVNIRLTNNSWGGGGFSQALHDAMSRAEAAGVLHICAAGNNGSNTDVEPDYPADFDDRGIVSVMATDTNDVRAYFTNYGYASVDLAAPGVNILSTVPTGACPLCDPTGYKVLSGTSMASPHVAGVAAALFDANPALTPAQLRDVLLDPGSYDAVTDSFTARTSTSGRLNFDKALHNPRLFAPHANTFPVATLPSRVGTYAEGVTVTTAGSASDADHDSLHSSWTRDDSPVLGDWLMGRMIEDRALFAATSGAPVSFSAPSVSLDTTMSYVFAVADGHGGSALARQTINVLKSATPGSPPKGKLTVSPTSGPVGTVVTIKIASSDPDGEPTEADIRLGGLNFSSAACCYDSTSPLTWTLGVAGVYRVAAQVIDTSLAVSPTYTQVVRIGGAVGEPPLAKLTVDRVNGPVPLSVTFDARGSTDADGNIARVMVMCDDSSAWVNYALAAATGTCTYTTPGPHALQILVQDSTGYMDSSYAYIMATDPSTPVTAVTSPATNANVPKNANTTITASASGPQGVAQVQFYVDGALKCTDTSAPYSCVWKVPTGKGFLYKVQTKAIDAQGNFGCSQAINVISK